MRKHYLAVLFAAVSMFGTAAVAQTLDQDAVVVKVPYEFVVGGRVLPEGTYTVSRRDSSGARETLVVRSSDTKTSVLVLPTTFTETRFQDSRLDFENVGSKHFLSQIQTPDGTYTIAIPPAAIKVAQMEQQHGVSPSSGN